MKTKNLTPEQREQLSAGCVYTLLRGVCTLLIVGVFLYGVPLLASSAFVYLMFTIVGMIIVAERVARLIYSRTPLQDLWKKLEKEEVEE